MEACNNELKKAEKFSITSEDESQNKTYLAKHRDEINKAKKIAIKE